MKKMIVTICLTCLISLSFPAHAQETTTVAVGLIDMEKVFQEFYKTKIADANLKKQAETYKIYAEQLSESRDKLEAEFKSLRDASQNIALSEVERESRRLAAQDKYRQLQTKESELAQYDRDKRKQLQELYEQQREKLLDEIRKSVDIIRRQRGYSIVIDHSGRTLNNIPSVVAYDPELDLTAIVLEQINRPAKSKKDK